ncbi:MAG: ribosome biogenesis GTPase YqeH, partial [Erysipelotrichaceae bacterium]|nr:ribosome biogenesis GTPase YqeH [Erysipelotrichaceae bacterium]
MITEIRKCRGCGAVLQNNDPEQIGYAPDENMEYCQRCFRLIHYDRQMPVEIEAMHTLDMLEDVSGGFIWLIDLADLETSLYSDFARFYQRRECLVVLTKADIMPRTLTDRKIRS